MNQPSRIGTVLRSGRIRSWAIKIGVTLLVLELAYVVAGNLFIRSDLLPLTGKDLEVLGWIHVRSMKADGRLLTKYGLRAAGVALDQGKAKVQISKPRNWFEERGSAAGSSR